MNANLIFRATAVAALTAILSGGAGAQNPGQSVTFTNAPITNVVAQMSQKYGVNIILKGKFDPTKRVTFTVDNVGGSDTRLRLVNAFVSAIDGDFRKVYVLSKIAPGSDADSATFDAASSPLIFKNPQVSVAAAAQAIAGADAAYVQIGPGVEGTVTFNSTNLTAGTAAAQLAKQTSTRWKQFYAVAPRGQRNLLTALNRAAGDPANQPISPISSYTKANPQATAMAAETPTDPNAPQASNDGSNANGYFGMNYNPYLPYGYGQGGISPGLGFNNDPYYAFQTGPVFNNGSPYQNTFGGFSNGGFSTGSGLVVLPTFPNFGGYNGPIVIGGY